MCVPFSTDDCVSGSNGGACPCFFEVSTCCVLLCKHSAVDFVSLYCLTDVTQQLPGYKYLASFTEIQPQSVKACRATRTTNVHESRQQDK